EHNRVRIDSLLSFRCGRSSHRRPTRQRSSGGSAMPTRPFSADAAIAHATAAPRGIAFYLGTRDGRSSNLRDARRTVKPVLPGWEVHRIAEVEGWFEAAPPAGTPYPLG